MKALKYAVMAAFHSCMFSLCAHVLKTIIHDTAYTDLNVFVVALLALINLGIGVDYIIKALDELVRACGAK